MPRERLLAPHQRDALGAGSGRLLPALGVASLLYPRTYPLDKLHNPAMPLDNVLVVVLRKNLVDFVPELIESGCCQATARIDPLATLKLTPSRAVISLRGWGLPTEEARLALLL
jgi:hypothetical protein